MGLFKKEHPIKELGKEYFKNEIRCIHAEYKEDKEYIYDCFHEAFEDLIEGGLKRSKIHEWTYFYLYNNHNGKWSVEACMYDTGEMEIVEFEEFCEMCSPKKIDFSMIKKLI